MVDVAGGADDDRHRAPGRVPAVRLPAQRAASPRQHLVPARFDRPQVQDDGVVVDATDDRGRADSQPPQRSRPGPAAQCETPGGERLARERAAAYGRFQRQDDGRVTEPRQLLPSRLGPRSERIVGRGDGAPDRDLGRRQPGAVEPQRRRDAGQRHLVGPHRAGQWFTRMLADDADRPTISPACGPPTSLSPLKQTRSAPEAKRSIGVGSWASPKAACRGAPRSRGHPPRRPRLVGHSGHLGRVRLLDEALHPKFEGWTRRMARAVPARAPRGSRRSESGSWFPPRSDAGRLVG